MNKKIKISALVLTLCIGAAVFTSCGRKNDTTHDAGSNGQVVTTTSKTETKTEAKTEAKTEITTKVVTEEKTEAITTNKNEGTNENGTIGEVVTDVTRGARNIVGGVAEGARDMMGGTHNNANNNGSPTTRPLPRNGK